MKQLIKEQVIVLNKYKQGVKSWRFKKEFLIKLINSYGFLEINESNIDWFMESYLVREEARINLQDYAVNLVKIKRKLKPIASDNKTKLLVGKSYKISTHKKRVFVLESIDYNTNKAILRPQKYNKHKRITCKIDELRELRKNS